MALMYAACHRVLAPAGVLAVIIASRANGGQLDDPAGHAVTAGRAGGTLAWRNGLAALLAGLIGFGLTKGRSDITQLGSLYAAIVGCLLVASLTAGAASAVGPVSESQLPEGPITGNPLVPRAWRVLVPGVG